MKFPKPTPKVKARKPLRRGKRLRPVGKTAHARRERGFEYMGWVKTRPCLARLLNIQGVDCQGPIEAHHMFGRYGAKSDRKCVPLCTKCHRAWHEARGIFAGWGKERRRVWAVWSVEFTQLEHLESQRPFIGIDRTVGRRMAAGYVKDGPTMAEIIADASRRK